ncbi:MAG: PIN domain-containing protein, partial [Acidobacteria bacterium]|nr:PIN domain-containing protein [Acidobacteriota bacterium]
MTRLLLDTTFLIDAERDAASLNEAIADDDDAAIAAITVAELRVGAELASGRRRVARRSFVDRVVAALPVVNYDLAVAEAHAKLLTHVRREGTPRGAHDLIIAATAVAAARSIVTADRSAFESLPG